MEPEGTQNSVYDYEEDYIAYEEEVERQEFWERLVFVAILVSMATLMSAFTGFNYENYLLSAMYGVAYKVA